MRDSIGKDRSLVDDGRTITIRLAPDGRVLFHDLTPDLLPVARQLNPADGTLRRRQLAAEKLSEDNE
jgi:hypothetical protein